MMVMPSHTREERLCVLLYAVRQTSVTVLLIIPQSTRRESERESERERVRERVGESYRVRESERECGIV